MIGQPGPSSEANSLSAAGDLRTRFRIIAELAERPVEPVEFYAAMLRALAVDLPHDWSIVWSRAGDRWEFVARHGVVGERVDREIAGIGNAEVLAAWEERGQGARFRAGSQDTPHLITLAMVGETPVVVQLAVRGASMAREFAASRRELVEAYGQLSADFGRLRTLRGLRTALQRQARFDDLSRAIHGSLDLERTAYEIVAGWVRLTGCARVSLAVADGDGFRLVAVSGVASIDQRSPPVRALAELASGVAVLGQPVRYAGSDAEDAESGGLPPAVAGPLDEYLDWSHAAGLIAIPLVASRTADEQAWAGLDTPGPERGPTEVADCQAVLVVELADADRLRDAERDLIEWGPRLAVAVRNSRSYSDLPLRGLAERWRRWRGPSRSRRWRSLAVVCGVALAATVLILFPARLRVEAAGTLQPAVIHHAFAPRDGYVAEIWVEHAQAVLPRDELLRLESPELELEVKRTEGAIESTEKELRAAEAARRRGVSSSSGVRDETASFAVNEERLRAILASQQEQLVLLRGEQGNLLLRSPIAGTVLTWQVRQTLLGRPVPRGQRLLRIAAQDSPWKLVLELPDRDAGRVLRARERLGPNLKVDYALATAPGRRLRGELVDMAKITEVSENGTPFVEVTVAIEGTELLVPRAGAQVRAAIDCGHYPLGYVWFYRVWDGLRSVLGP